MVSPFGIIFSFVVVSSRYGIWSNEVKRSYVKIFGVPFVTFKIVLNLDKTLK